ncbi:uncharacterized protein LOC129216158 [Uloborus diversus]|uniref:uncharacterized protein LOC129216158 n=1 Tax=Uloborus diversus TaxID=327109 RepID=UPI0024090497|nr:uncharacterized protein LOC129216158 [Uloborus diversus]
MPLKMETYIATKAKGNHSSQECSQKSLTPEESARKVKNDFRQNNAQLNPVSFIPVHTKQLMCHKFPSNKRDFDTNSEEHPYAANVCSTNTVSPKCNADQKEKSSWLAKAHIRRRSVGFEDMTSVASNYGQNFSNERRFQAVMPNSNTPGKANAVTRNILELESENNFEKQNECKNSISTVNQNMQNSSENENDVCLRNETVRQKDKSSKRKSSLNRIDFIHSPAPNIENAYYRQNSVKQKNSSSDEGSEEIQALQSLEFSNSNSKRKHNPSNGNISVLNLPGRKAKEVLQQGLSKVRTNLLPRTLQNNHSKLRQPRWKQHATAHSSQKLSHSAGELETTSDFPDKCSNNSICLSAQEFDVQGYSEINSKHRNVSSKRHSAQSFGNNSLHYNASGAVGDNSSQLDQLNNDKFSCCSAENDQKSSLLTANCKSSINFINTDSKTDKSMNTSSENNEILSKVSSDQEANLSCPKRSDSNINCGTVESSDCQDVHDNTIKMGNLEISPENGDDNEVNVSADESNDLVGSDGERRPSSILRKKFSEERKELHSILKPPPEDKLSKAPPSILKHRESSEEKESWPQSDLHSILKKSTSEDESCNSGPDIRPILKVSTDDESPGGSVRPRPILKKRTSFSDECCYASFPSGELKPILKKKTPLSSEDQPRPILKSRRKSEDTRSTLTEFIASRPRAYSADMGVKLNHDTHSEGAELQNDFYQQNCHDL